MAAAKLKETKNQRRRALAKAKKQKEKEQKLEDPKPQDEAQSTDGAVDSKPVPSILSMDDDFNIDDPAYAAMKSVLNKFNENEAEAFHEPDRGEVIFNEDDDIPSEDDEKNKRKSRKQKKYENRLSIADLKALVEKPEMVEWTDVNAPDPLLLLDIKAHRNVVPVPNHWSLKREYLSTKRGIEKPPFQLPKFITDTGIVQMRQAVLDKQEGQTLRQKQRERVQGKLGKLDIDYNKLYEAFFKFQTKPHLTRYGEVYYEGKEFETNLKHLRPGQLSPELIAALSIPPGAPPPWLINQQRFGPPPAYPALPIPGLNAPLPPGADWGYQPGGYGKPPTDEYNRPLYGGSLGTQTKEEQVKEQKMRQLGEPTEKFHWGEIIPVESESEEEDDEDEEDDDEDEEMQEDDGDMEAYNAAKPSAPIEAQGEEEDVSGDFTLRKEKHRPEEEYREAYTVLKEKSNRATGFFGSEKTYDLNSMGEKKRKRQAGDVDVSVDVDELGEDGRLSKSHVEKQFEREMQHQRETHKWARPDQDDLSQMIADESRKRLKKDQEKRAKR